MQVLLDTNILIRVSEPQSVASRAVIREIENGSKLVLVPQVLREYWAVVTRPPESNGMGLTPEQAGKEIGRLTERFELILDSPDCYRHWERLVSRYGIKGIQTHDTNLVGTMLTHGIPSILTLNRADFDRFTEIRVISP